MIRGNRASFTVHSDSMTVSEISVMLGLEPTRSGDKGDLTPAGRSGRDVAPERLRYQQTYWSLTVVDDEPPEDDQTGLSALRALAAKLEPNVHLMSRMRDDGDTRIWWSGDSDSVQGGFVLEADLIRSLAALNCDVYGTAYLAEEVDGVDSDDGDVVEFRIGNTSGGSK